jgi:hypothetical protein
MLMYLTGYRSRRKFSLGVSVNLAFVSLSGLMVKEGAFALVVVYVVVS